MEIESKFFGRQVIAEDDIYHFTAGIPGFCEETKFVLFPLVNTPLFVLQSIQTKEVAFIMTEPFIFFRDYEFELAEEEKDYLQIKEKQSGITVYVILNVKEPFTKTTANLQAPVIINETAKLGKQIILTNNDYCTKHLLIPAAVKGEK
ncbi:flagellar assembly protein FliW [Bacillaceae bacterium Marseille-Q3522]|nr:flagellar assembly protein FliW [Bacillaceae bacterium Marseille-Q3522]